MTGTEKNVGGCHRIEELLFSGLQATGSNQKGLESNYCRLRCCRTIGLHKSFQTNCKWTAGGSWCEERKKIWRKQTWSRKICMNKAWMKRNYCTFKCLGTKLELVLVRLLQAQLVTKCRYALQKMSWDIIKQGNYNGAKRYMTGYGFQSHLGDFLRSGKALCPLPGASLAWKCLPDTARSLWLWSIHY